MLATSILAAGAIFGRRANGQMGIFCQRIYKIY